MKKILLYTDAVYTGGAELQMYLLAKFLDKSNFTPILACSSYPELDKWCAKFNAEGIKVIRINVKSKHDPKHYFQLKKILKEEKIDILHAHIWNPASGRYAYLAAKSTKIPLITTEHDPFELTPFKNFLKKKLLNNVTKIIAISNDNKKILQKLYPEQAKKVEMIHNGIDITWWQSQLLRFTDDDFHHIKEGLFKAKLDSLIVITVAELHERKGIKYLLQAIPEIVEKFANIKFVIIGDGPDRANLEHLAEKLKISDNVIFLGKQKEIPKLLKSSNIFVLPSRREGFGLVNLEAMITPLPIIATKAGGIPEIVKDKETGILIEPENSEELTKALIKLIADPKLREKYSLAAYDRVTKSFDARIMAKEYEKAYENIR